MGHAHAPVVDAQRVGGDLREHGLHALPQRRRAGDHVERTVRGHAYAGDIDGAQAALFQEEGEADADRFARGAALFELAL